MYSLMAAVLYFTSASETKFRRSDTFKRAVGKEVSRNRAVGRAIRRARKRHAEIGGAR